MSSAVIPPTSLSRQRCASPSVTGSRVCGLRPRTRAVVVQLRVSTRAYSSTKRRAAAANPCVARCSTSARRLRLDDITSLMTSRPNARCLMMSAANLRAAASVSGAPMAGSPSISFPRSTGPKVNFPVRPSGRRKRRAHDFAPLGWMMIRRPGQPPSGTSMRRSPGDSFWTAAAVSAFFAIFTRGATRVNR